MKIRAVICLLSSLILPATAMAWPIKDLMSFKSLTVESATQAAVKSVQNQLDNTTDQLLKVTGDLGNLNFSPQFLFGTDTNPLVGKIQPISVSLPSLGLTGETTKNTSVTQGVLNQMVLMPVGSAINDLTTAQKEAINNQQQKLVQDLAVQGIAKANVDKSSAIQVEAKTDASEKMINSAKTERDATQAYAHVTAALATNFSDVVDKASANLAVVSSSRLSSIIEISEPNKIDKESETQAGG